LNDPDSFKATFKVILLTPYVLKISFLVLDDPDSFRDVCNFAMLINAVVEKVATLLVSTDNRFSQLVFLFHGYPKPSI
jgi:hypothetical protein